MFLLIIHEKRENQSLRKTKCSVKLSFLGGILGVKIFYKTTLNKKIYHD